MPATPQLRPVTPRIITWKWTPEIFEGDTLERRIADMVARTDFDVVYQCVHWIGLSWFNPRLREASRRAVQALHAAGRSFVIDCDVRDEGDEFAQEFPDKLAHVATLVEVPLDARGSGEAVIPPAMLDRWIRKRPAAANGVIRAWALRLVDRDHYDPASLQEITKAAELQPLADHQMRLTVEAGPAQAGKRAVVAVSFSHLMPDQFAPEMREYLDRMLKGVSDLGADGAAYGEWGQSPIFQWKPHVHFRHFPWSRAMGDAYRAKTGRDLDAELLLVRYAGAGQDSARFRAINDYLELFRDQTGDGEEFYYAKIKQYLGPTAMVMDHPTFAWFYMDVIYNGLSWWQARRDYSQTDEDAPYPLRLALARKWSSPVWFNMFYSAGTLRIETYFHETWRNAIFGGRTNYLGYECGDRTIDAEVLELKEGDHLERIREMEQAITVIDGFQRSLPDSRVALVFGYQAATNWMLNPEFDLVWDWRHPVMQQVTDTMAGLFDGENYLFDLISSSEIARGDLRLEGGKLTYGRHTYDAMVFLHPEGLPPSVLEFLKVYAVGGGKLALYGECRWLHDGSPATKFEEVRQAATHYEKAVPPAAEIARVLRSWGVASNKWDTGCVFRDGSVIFTAATHHHKTQVLRHRGNPLKVDFVHQGHRVEFEGDDYLCLDLRPDGTIARLAAGAVRHLAISPSR